MKGISKWRLSAGLAFLVALGMAWGCAQEVGDIDRTQPNKIKKELFETDDEWYIQQTVIDTGMEGQNIGDGGTAPPDGSMQFFAFKALESPLKRVRWTVTENVLYAHSSIEIADGLNTGFDEDEARRQGVVAAFPIQGHFDVQRQYNAATGEPTNVIVEDTSDRPWYQRDYMRVDWSTNLVDGFRMFQGQFGSLSPADFHRPQQDDYIDPNRTRITNDYIDTVNEYFYEPDIYSCFGAFGLDAIWGCEGGRLSVRTAIMRVPEEETYKPLNFLDTHTITDSGDVEDRPMLTTSIFDRSRNLSIEVECTEAVKDYMLEDSGRHYDDMCRPETFDYHQRFGYFRTERMAWDRFTGETETNRRHYINRWNIWQSMLDDEGNRLPEEERIPKPITFYLNLEYPEFMFDAAQQTAEEWNRTFRRTVKLAMGIDADELDQMLMDEYGHTAMFRIVENSCHPGPLVDWFERYGDFRSADLRSPTEIFDDYVGVTSPGTGMERALWDISHEARENLCAELEYATEGRDLSRHRFTWERFGDLRYSFFNWVEESVPWAGYGPSSADPMTGEIIRGNANFAGAYIRQQARYAADLVQYFNGELDEQDIKLGMTAREDLFQNDLTNEHFGLTPEGRQEIASRTGGVAAEPLESTAFENLPELSQLDREFLDYGPDRIREEADRLSVAAVKGQMQDERLIEVLSKPAIKNVIMSDVEVQKLVEANAYQRYGPNFDGEQLHQAYLDLHTPTITYHRAQERLRELSARNIHLQEDMQNAIEMLITYQGVADFFQGADRAEIVEYFMNGMFIGTQLHEIGHTVGLRHNFGAHADALNYHDEFWLIQREVQRYRLINPDAHEQLKNGEINEADIEGISPQEAYSLQSGELLDQVVGPERAAGLDYLSVGETKLASIMDYTADMTGRFVGLGKYDRAAIKFGYGELAQVWDEDIEIPNAFWFYQMILNYTDLPYLFIGNVSEEIERGALDEGEYSNAPSSAHVEALMYDIGVDRIINGREYIPLNTAKEEARQRIKANTQNWENLEFQGSSLMPDEDRMVGYEFCSDEFNGMILDCSTWAYGGNQTEMVRHAFDTYRAFQPFWRYRGHRVAGNYENLQRYESQVLRTMQITQEPFRYYSFYRWFNLGDYSDDLLDAAVLGFNFFNEALGMPEPGRYCPYDEDAVSLSQWWNYDLDDTYVPARFHDDEGACAGHIDVELGEGFHYNYQFSQDYMYRIDRVGSYVDKLLASLMLFQMSADFAESAFFTDERATNLSYWTTFKDEMLKTMGGIILGDYKSFGPVVDGDGVRPYFPIDPATFGTGMPHSDEGLPRMWTPQSLNHEMNMLLGGLIFASGWRDREVDFTHYLKVATTNDEWQPMGDGVDVVEFVHPITGQIYRAPDLGEYSIGARLVDRANELGERYEQIEAQYANATPGTSGYENVRRARDIRREQMQDIVAKMDLIRFAIENTDAVR